MGLALSAEEHSMLGGARGEAAARALRLVIAFGEAMGAKALLPISAAHIDGCLYHGQVSLDFVEQFVQLKGHIGSGGCRHGRAQHHRLAGGWCID